jgi:adenylate cyclase
MPVVARALALGLLTALAGLIASILVQVTHLEEEVGLNWLFGLRGPRAAPDQVVLVAIDRDSSDALGLPYKPDRWPRFHHAELVRTLTRLGARVIVFDMHFKEPRDGVQDSQFARAIHEAGNVVLFEYLQVCHRPQDCGLAFLPPGQTLVIKRFPPLPELSQAAAAVAPFPLPKWPLQKYRAWLFAPSAGDAATLPAVAFQLYAGNYIPRLLDMIRDKTGDDHLRQYASDIAPNQQVVTLMQRMRQRFQGDPSLGPGLLETLEEDAGTTDSRASAMLASLIEMYSGLDSRFLDFYGPAHSVPTVPYYRVLQRGGGEGGEPIDFKGKVVFVGAAENLRQEQGDTYPSPFSMEMSGVEFAATALANLLDGRKVRPLGPLPYTLVILLWGLLLGVLFLYIRAVYLVPLAAVLAAAYIAGAYAVFARDGTWLPIVTPLLLQLPVALVAGLVWQYRNTHHEREKILGILKRYLPPDVVGELLSAPGDPLTRFKLVNSICLETDAEQFTQLSEILEPEALKRHLDRYFKAVFEPVVQRGGFISDVVGDAVLAIWVNAGRDRSVRAQACQAALDIVVAVDAFNRDHPEARLPTRIGVHCGEVVLGNVGTGDHLEYRAVGDAVNAATRVEGLNKQLGTQLLVSDDMVQGLDEIVTRELGSFRLKGKRKPLVIHELVGRAGQVDAARLDRCARFATALEAFREQQWHKATQGFKALLIIDRDDGPSRYYLQLCERYIDRPPPPPWDPVINLTRK